MNASESIRRLESERSATFVKLPLKSNILTHPLKKRENHMQDFKNKKSYLDLLKCRREALQAIKDATPSPPTLTEKIDAWFSGLSQEDQGRAYKMLELKQIFSGETSQKIGAALWELGWSRRRSWKDDRPTSRHWYKKDHVRD